jgi:hypothetical protein
MQMPMPHSGARGSPLTEIRHAAPAIINAAATVVPSRTFIRAPFTVIQQPSLIDRTFSSPCVTSNISNDVHPFVEREVENASLNSGSARDVLGSSPPAFRAKLRNFAENKKRRFFERETRDIDHVTN